MPRDEVEAAYFTLLRAREELDGVRRFGEYLRDEGRRLRRALAEGQALADSVDRRLRRPLRHTDQPLEEAIRGRLAVIEDELGLLPEREAAAEAFVEDCERELTQLRGGR
jgi:hypothetical protein